MSNAKIYLIPGLGADGRMYTPQLKVLKDAVILEHQKPLERETITEYSKRLSAKVDTSEPFIIVGTSLGGMIAIEMSKFIHPEKIILISSVKHRGELPAWMRAMKHLKMHHFLTGERLIRLSNSNVKPFISMRDTNVARLIVDMHNSADPEFVGWAINEVVNWDGGKDYRKDIIHIHGTKDRLFPHRNIKNAVHIPGGSHIMGLTQSHDVNKALLEAIGSS
jgi:pimeloyl-ACP methyl ester carboxylesterase